MADEFAIIWTVKEEGFIFEAKVGNRTVAFDNLNDVSIANKHLVSVQIINQLIDDEKATLNDDKVIIPHKEIAVLSAEESAALSLPESFPFDIEIRAKGILTDPTLIYTYRFLNGRSQPFVKPKKIGSYLEITAEQTYLLTAEQYFLVDAIDSFNNRNRSTVSREYIKNNLLEFAKIKGLAQEVGATLDTYLSSEQVIAPTKISLRLKKIDDDTVEVEPVLCEDEQIDGSATLKPALEANESDNFVRTFDRMPRVRDIYPVPKGPKIVLNEQLTEALNQVKQNRKASGKQKELLLKNPQQIFDPELFHLDDFSERVIEIGEHKPRVFPFLKPTKETWLPPEGGIIIDGAMFYVPAGEEIQLKEQLEQAVSKGIKEVNWQGQSIAVAEETIQAVQNLAEARHTDDTSVAAPKDSADQQKSNKNVLIIKDNFDNVDFTEGNQARPGTSSLPSNLRPNIKLLEHQKMGLEWLQKLWINGAKGGLLADDMGLGKTLQSLSFLSWVRELMDEGKIEVKPILIVAPVVLLKNWNDEYRKFLEPVFGSLFELHSSNLRKLKNKDIATQLDIIKEIDIKDKNDAEEMIRSGKGLLLNYNEIRNKGAVLTTYETLRDYQFSFGLVDWSVIVLDETQKIKNPSAMVTGAVKAMKYDFAVSLTGTPVENSWVDLWSIMDFIQPGLLGSLKSFVSEYQTPLKKPDTNREALGKSLKEKINPYMLRRMKEDHLEGLPVKRIRTYETTMPKEQLNYYMEVIKKARQDLPDKQSGKRKQHILQTIAALRDISLHPYLNSFSETGLANMSDEKIINSSARLLKTMEILDEIHAKGEKAIVFVISRKMQRVMQRLIQNRYNITCLRPVNGEVAGGRRKTLVDSFQQSEGFNAIIMSPEAAGVGLTVTAANHVIHLCRAWNPAKEDQATDRVYRIGQDKPVTIHIPLSVHPLFDNEECNGTFDLKLNRLLDMKRHLSRSVLLPPVIEEKEWQSFGEGTINIPLEDEGTSTYLTIDEVDATTPINFEKIVAAIYEKLGYNITLTSESKDFGADVIALGKNNNMPSLLIQCKHTITPTNKIGTNGIHEVLYAVGVYSKDYNTQFNKVVITNAVSFTEQAYQLASANGVELIARKDVSSLLKEYKTSVQEIVW